MNHIDLTEFEEGTGFTVKLSGPPGLIAVHTLIETLAGFSASLEAIAATVEPRYDLEVYVDRVSPGSVNIGIRLTQHIKRNAKAYALATGVAIATPGVHRDIIVGLFTNFLYDQIKPQEKCEVDVGTDKVTVKGSNCHVTIRRQVYDLKPWIDGNPKVAEGVERALKAVKKDRAVKSVGVAPKSDGSPAVVVTRANVDEALRRLGDTTGPFQSVRLFDIAQETPALVHETRLRNIRANLTIIKAVLLRSKRKWQFNWQGITISAPIVDSNFFDELEARSVALRQGDALDGELTITQRFIPGANVWVNHSYSVTKVYSVKLGETQTRMDFIPSPDPDALPTNVAPPRLQSPRRGDS